MNVFVLCTGRCGSNTFARACSHITNYSSAHESQRGRLDREYPENHIEVDNSLSRLLGELDDRYGDDAFYVHLRRDREDTARSFERGWEKSPKTVVEAHATLVGGLVSKKPVLDICRHYCKSVNLNIELFLKDKTNSMEVRLESAKKDFREFWNQVDAEGNLNDSLSEWDRNYNASDSTDRPTTEPEVETNPFVRTVYEVGRIPIRVARKTGRVLRKLPRFLKRA
ncbi:hypothetical protein GGP50_002668 [Salinibacter ruber]|nr:hypothetical protein [Salinibacter ruber]